MQRFALALLFLLVMKPVPVIAESIRVAVAANFYPVMVELAESFEKNECHQVELVVGSSGKLAAQIIQGAPFDLFLSADTIRAEQLENRGLAVDGTRETYAKGQLVVLLRYLENRSGQLGIESFDVERIAIANPDLAPYGRAARQALNFIGLQFDRKKLVYGENVSQAFHFFETGNVDVAFVALSQVMESSVNKRLYLPVNEQYYDPIEQQMILLSDKSGARELYEYILSDPAQNFISESGYDSVKDSLEADTDRVEAIENGPWDILLSIPGSCDTEKGH